MIRLITGRTARAFGACWHWFTSSSTFCEEHKRIAHICQNRGEFHWVRGERKSLSNVDEQAFFFKTRPKKMVQWHFIFCLYDTFKLLVFECSSFMYFQWLSMACNDIRLGYNKDVQLKPLKSEEYVGCGKCDLQMWCKWRPPNHSLIYFWQWIHEKHFQRYFRQFFIQ